MKQIGKGGEYLLPQFVPADKLPLLEKEINAFRKKLFHREYIDRIVPFADARRLLERMRQRGLRIAVATSSEKEDLEAFKTILKIHDLIEEDATADDADKPKPEPDIFQAALKLLKIEPAEALALGDTPGMFRLLRRLVSVRWLCSPAAGARKTCGTPARWPFMWT